MADIHRLKVFLTAAETMNFTETARRMHMTQPSVSQHIQALEQYFDVALFDRAGRYLQLTEAGERLMPLVREMVRQWVRIEESMETMKGEVAGHLLVGCSTTPGKYILPQLLAQFHTRYPRVKVSCHVSSQEHALQMLCEGDVHCALASAPHTTYGEIEFYPLISDPISLIAPLDHPWAQEGAISPQMLREGQFIMREEGSGTREAVREALADVEVDEAQLNTLIVLGNSEAIALAVQEGLGVGFVSNIVVSRLVADRVAVIPIEGLNITRDIYFCYHLRRPSTMAHTAFRKFVIDEAYQGAEEPAGRLAVALNGWEERRI